MSELIVDAGNARVKWAISDGGEIGPIGWADHGSDAQSVIARVCAAVSDTVRQVVIGNVAGAEFGAGLERALRRMPGVDVWFARSEPETAGVRCGYTQPRRLGVDRWAAIVAAVERSRRQCPGRPLCIVDAGTALTIDAVDHQTRHIGGLILPGLRLQRAALSAAAADIAVPEIQSEETLPRPAVFARSTAQALEISGPIACAAVVDRCAATLTSEFAVPWLVMTGGDARRLEPWLATPCDICPNLVLEGLAILYEQRSPD